MFGSKQAHDAQSHATAAWNELVEALGSTRDIASDRAKDMGSEAGRRFTGAWDVLSGRPARPSAWPLIGAMAAGLVAGWIAAEMARRRRTEIDQAVASVGHEIKHAKQNVADRMRAAVNSNPSD